ncbi:MAG: anti-sigma factor [Pseudoflavonifractor sp.]|nr:anti-sigma factor [Pseudoflavonifractor sp.]
MPNCDEYELLLSARLDGALSSEEAARLEAHLANCSQCRALEAELTALEALWPDLPPVQPPPADLNERIMASVRAEKVIPPIPTEHRKPPLRWKHWAATAAVFALIFAGAGALRHWQTDSSANPQAGQAMPFSAEIKAAPVPSDTQDAPTVKESQADEAATGNDSARMETFAFSKAADPAPAPADTQDALTTEASQADDVATGSDSDRIETFTYSKAADSAPAGGADTLTQSGALDLLLAQQGWSEYSRDPEQDTVIFPTDPALPGVVTVLSPQGLSGNGKYYVFDLQNQISESGADGSETTSTSLAACYAVPLDGGKILEGPGTEFDALISE